jgi:hypothetical protein
MAAKMSQEEFLVCAANLIKTRIEEEQPTDEPKIEVEKKKKKGKKNEKNEIEDDGWTENGRWMTEAELHRCLSKEGSRALSLYCLAKREKANKRGEKTKKRKRPLIDDRDAGSDSDNDGVDGSDKIVASRENQCSIRNE